MADAHTTFLRKKPLGSDGKLDNRINKNLSLIRRTANPIPDNYRVSGGGRASPKNIGSTVRFLAPEGLNNNSQERSPW